MDSKPTCEYLVLARYFHLDENREMKPFGVEKVFNQYPDNPIKDREEAFKYRDEIMKGLMAEFNIIDEVGFEDLSEIEKRDLFCQHFLKEQPTYFRNLYEERVSTLEDNLMIEKWLESKPTFDEIKYDELKNKQIDNPEIIIPDELEKSRSEYKLWRDDMPQSLISKRKELTYSSDGETKSFDIYNDTIYFEHPIYTEGIWVIMEHNDEKLFSNYDDPEYGNYKNRLVIDRIAKKGDFKNYIPPSFYGHLSVEFEFYEKHSYSTTIGDIEYRDDVVFCCEEEFYEGDYWNDIISNYKILKTPFDWTEYDKPFWWKDPDDSKELDRDYLQYVKDKEEREEREKEWEENLPAWEDVWKTDGENHFKEFKPTLIYHFTTKKEHYTIRHGIAKTICAFLNSSGGYLFVGVNDEGVLNGLEYDFKLLQNNSKNSREGQSVEDKFQLKFDAILNDFFERSVHSSIRGYITLIQEVKCFVIEVQKSSDSVFLKGTKKKWIEEKNDWEYIKIKEFYYRKTASSEKIQDPEELVRYCKNHWKWKR